MRTHAWQLRGTENITQNKTHRIHACAVALNSFFVTREDRLRRKVVQACSIDEGPPSPAYAPATVARSSCEGRSGVHDTAHDRVRQAGVAQGRWHAVEPKDCTNEGSSHQQPGNDYYQASTHFAKCGSACTIPCTKICSQKASETSRATSAGVNPIARMARTSFTYTPSSNDMVMTRREVHSRYTCIRARTRQCPSLLTTSTVVGGSRFDADRSHSGVAPLAL